MYEHLATVCSVNSTSYSQYCKNFCVQRPSFTVLLCVGETMGTAWKNIGWRWNSSLTCVQFCCYYCGYTYVPANMKRKRRPYYGSRCIRLTVRWLALTLRATQQLTSVLPRASWSSFRRQRCMSVASSLAAKTRWAPTPLSSTAIISIWVLKFKVREFKSGCDDMQFDMILTPDCSYTEVKRITSKNVARKEAGILELTTWSHTSGCVQK